MKWTTKAFIQRVLSRAPGGRSLYYVGQRLIGGFRNFKINGKVRQGMGLLEALNEIGENLEGRNTVEIGTGWAPVVPLLFWLHGQKECHTFDITKLLKPSLVVESARQLLALSARADAVFGQWVNHKQFQVRKELLREMLKAGVGGHQIIRNCNIHYCAPSDAATTNLSGESVDLVYSNTVLEHVSLPEIHRLFSESYRILRSGGCMLHLIDLSDHFAHADASISTINFLQFSEAAFAKYNSAFCFQNRLRAPTYRQVIIDHGFEIVHWEPRVDDQALRQLPRLSLHEDFASLTATEICTSSIRVVAKRL